MAEMVRINDSNYQKFLSPIVDGRKMLMSSRGMFSHASGYKSFADQVQIPLMTDDEIDDRIREQQKEKSDLKTMCLDSGLEVLFQARTNYCWANGPAFCAMVIRMMETNEEVRFSPASVGTIVKNGRNQGGWGDEAVEQMVKRGINKQEDWGANAIDLSLNTPENAEKAAINKVFDFFVCNTHQEVKSCAAAGVPVAAGYNWWRHLIAILGLELGNHNKVIANSWGVTWGDRGYGILEGRKGVPDGAIAIISMSPV